MFDFVVPSSISTYLIMNVDMGLSPCSYKTLSFQECKQVKKKCVWIENLSQLVGGSVGTLPIFKKISFKCSFVVTLHLPENQF